MFIMNMTHMLHSRYILNKNEVISIKTGLNRVVIFFYLSSHGGVRTTFHVIMTILIGFLISSKLIKYNYVSIHSSSNFPIHRGGASGSGGQIINKPEKAVKKKNQGQIVQKI